MTRFDLKLLRHGPPERPGLFMGRTDDAPIADGVVACVAQAENLGMERLVTSDLMRCQLAVEAIGASLDLTPVTDPRWRELDFGEWDGKAAADIDSEALGRFWSDPDAHPPPGGERWSSLVGRVASAIGGLEPRPTLVVTHAGSIRAALHVLCSFTQRQLWAFKLPYGAVLSLSVFLDDRPSAQITGLRP